MGCFFILTYCATVKSISNVGTTVKLAADPNITKETMIIHNSLKCTHTIFT